MSSYIISRMGFLPSLGYTIAGEKFLNRSWHHEVCSNLILGAIPLWSVVEKLVNEMKVEAVLSMNESFELKYLTPSREQWAAKGVDQLNIPVTDFVGLPTIDQIAQGVQFIHENVTNEKTVYVHCKAGRSRSATMVACYLIRHWGMTPDEATNYVLQKRNHVWFGDKNLRTISEYHNHLTSSNQP